MVKITFRCGKYCIVRNVLGIWGPSLRDAEIALYDIDGFIENQKLLKGNQQ